MMRSNAAVARYELKQNTFHLHVRVLQANGHAMSVVTTVLEKAAMDGVISPEQHRTLLSELARASSGLA